MAFERLTLALVLVTSGVVPGVAAQATTQTPSSSSTSLMTLSGCVARSSDSQKRFTLQDGELGEVYTLTGVNVKDFVGKRVTVQGAPAPKRLKVTGGLYPSPNVAAQGGAIDPGRAAIAAQSAPAANTSKAPDDFRVRSVRALPGNCPDSNGIAVGGK